MEVHHIEPCWLSQIGLIVTHRLDCRARGEAARSCPTAAQWQDGGAGPSAGPFPFAKIAAMAIAGPAVGDNAKSENGLGSLLLAQAPLKQVETLTKQLAAERAASAGQGQLDPVDPPRVVSADPPHSFRSRRVGPCGAES
jgi:hypothetical protein